MLKFGFTELLLAVAVVCIARFGYTWINLQNSQSVSMGLEEIHSCSQYIKISKQCTQKATSCLEVISGEKDLQDAYSQRIAQCQEGNARNSDSNNQLRQKLDRVTERLNQIVGKRQNVRNTVRSNTKGNQAAQQEQTAQQRQTDL